MKRLIILTLISISLLSLWGKSKIRFQDLKCDNFIEREKDKELATEEIWSIYENEDFEGFSWVTQIEYYHNKLYVLDHEQWIHVFDTDGNYLDIYGNKGKGPGEIVLVKDIDLFDNHIYQLDKGKYTVSKFTLDYDFVWEKKIPSQFSEKNSPEEIEVNDKGVFLSGFSTNSHLKAIPILYQFDNEMNFKRELLLHSSDSKDAWGIMLKTLNRMTTDNNRVYLGLSGGKDFLYAWNLNDNQLDYVIQKETPNNGKYELMKHESGGVELMCYFSALDLNSSKNYLLAGENGGAYTKEDDKIKVPDDYKNNAALYKKSGEYLGSVFLDIPYEYSSFTVELEETKSDLYFYIFSDNDLKLKKLRLIK